MNLHLTSSTEQLYRQIVQAREDERKQLARELHDQIIQSLVVLNHHLAAMRDEPPEDLNGQVIQLQQDVCGLINEVRNICANLRPSVLDTLGLPAAIRSHIRALQPTAACEISFQLEGASARLPEQVELCLYRIAQEALANALKHAQARHIRLSLACDPEAVTLAVQDDGHGFTPAPDLTLLLAEQHFGLVGMRERLELLDGSLCIRSAPGAGTRISATIPLAEPLASRRALSRHAEVSR